MKSIPGDKPMSALKKLSIKKGSIFTEYVILGAFILMAVSAAGMLVSNAIDDIQKQIAEKGFKS